MSQCMSFPTMWYVRPAKPQISLRIRAVWSEPLLIAWVFYNCWATDRTPFGVSNLYENSYQNPPLLQVDFRQNWHGISIFQLELTRRWNNCKNPGGIYRKIPCGFIWFQLETFKHMEFLSKDFSRWIVSKIVLKNPPGNSQGQGILGLTKFLSTSFFFKVEIFPYSVRNRIFLSWNLDLF